MSQIRPELLWVMAAQSASLVGGVIAIKVTTSLLGPAEYGQLAVALSIVGIVSMCLYGPVVQTASRFYAIARYGDQMRAYLITLTRLLGFCAFLVAVVSLFAGLLSWTVTGLAGLSIATAMAAYAVVSGSQATLIASYNAARKRGIAAAGLATEAALRPALIALLVLWLGHAAELALAAYAMTGLVILTMLVILIRPTALLDSVGQQDGAERRAQPETLPRRMLLYGWPFVLFGVAGALGSHGERLLLTAWTPWKTVGIYAAMSQLAAVPTAFLLGAINQFYFPLLFQQVSRDSRASPVATDRGYARYLAASLLVVALVAGAVTLFGEQVLVLVTTKDFAGYEDVLWLLAASAGLFHLGQQLTLEGFAANRPGRYIIPKLLHSISMGGLALALVPSYGVMGMAWASLLAAAIYATAIAVANRTSVRAGKAMLLATVAPPPAGHD